MAAEKGTEMATDAKPIQADKALVSPNGGFYLLRETLDRRRTGDRKAGRPVERDEEVAGFVETAFRFRLVDPLPVGFNGGENLCRRSLQQMVIVKALWRQCVKT